MITVLFLLCLPCCSCGGGAGVLVAGSAVVASSISSHYKVSLDEHNTGSGGGWDIELTTHYSFFCFINLKYQSIKHFILFIKKAFCSSGLSFAIYLKLSWRFSNLQKMIMMDDDDDDDDAS